MHSSPARFLIVIESGGAMVARLFDADRRQLTEMDASTEDVSATTEGLAPVRSALAPEWDRALMGHSTAERATARVYTLPI